MAVGGTETQGGHGGASHGHHEAPAHGGGHAPAHGGGHADAAHGGDGLPTDPVEFSTFLGSILVFLCAGVAILIWMMDHHDAETELAALRGHGHAASAEGHAEAPHGEASHAASGHLDAASEGGEASLKKLGELLVLPPKAGETRVERAKAVRALLEGAHAWDDQNWGALLEFFRLAKPRFPN